MLGIIKTNIIIGRLKTSSAQFWTNTLCPATLIHRHGPSVVSVLAAWSWRCGCRQRTRCRPLAPGSVSEGRTAAAGQHWPDWWSWQRRKPVRFPARRAGNKSGQKGLGPWQTQRTPCTQPELQHKSTGQGISKKPSALYVPLESRF